ncbi:hypothetical protein C2G38_2193374 [Gigaspora rosea]|uniref:Uncharacterized protein n=1 Tax=Gigaspora rosea TaxID=44941 RepID=A0A397UZM3_9GLOM|nr:hypothetical protein C2G38_2193374 [Gigaspora rosea]CAG8442708.1 24843_t:CDS:1 [Gigaspora rosea]
MSTLKTYKRSNNAEVEFDNAKNQYLAAIDKLFKVACASDDHAKAFKILEKIQDEGDNRTKGTIKFKLGILLLGGFGCTKNINEAQKLIKEASKHGHTHASVLVKTYNSSADFGASVVIKDKMV